MDPIYLLNIILIFVALVLLAVAVYLLVLIHEARKSLRRINSIIGFVEDHVLRQLLSFNSLSSLFKEGFMFLMSMRRSMNEKRKEGSDER